VSSPSSFYLNIPPTSLIMVFSSRRIAIRATIDAIRVLCACILQRCMSKLFVMGMGPGDLGLVAPKANQSIGDLAVRLGCIRLLFRFIGWNISEGKPFIIFPLGGRNRTRSSCVEFGTEVLNKNTLLQRPAGHRNLWRWRHSLWNCSDFAVARQRKSIPEWLERGYPTSNPWYF